MSQSTLDLDRLAEIAKLRRDDFASAEPYPHVVIDDFLPPELARQVLSEFESTRAGWAHYHHYNERYMGPVIRELMSSLQSPPFLRLMEELTGLEGLLADPEMQGAGMHRTLPGGHLNIHSDFLSHPNLPTWHRRINLLIYLNPGWRPEWMGDLEMWDRGMRRCVQSISPLFNRCVVFRTMKHSFHGHPQPLTCPPGEARRSLALYYFQETPEDSQLEPTIYHPRPGDSRLKRLVIAADDRLLGFYTLLKRKFGVRDGMVSRILRYF
jgi:Rps23 Pro-64 3,4-dihydroxylase Tpa1-like proline 4-hydroxylase